MIDTLSWITVYPEIILLVMACVIALVDLGVKTPLRGTTYILTLLTLAVVAALQAFYAMQGETVYGFGKMVVSDPMGNWLKCFAAITLMVSLVYGRPYAADRDMLRGGEYFTLSLFSLLGIFVMISGHNFLIIYMGLELMTLSSYALVALRRDNATATEAAMKYFVLGALASGFLLYGLSMIYGATGSLNVHEVFQAIASRQVKHQVLVFGLVFIVAGLAFKLGAVPFHMWLPDVYQGAPTAVTLLIGAAPQLAAFAICMRLLVQGMLPLAIDWQQMLAVLAVGSLLIGNFAAIAQTNLKRMLAFSTIAQMGFLLLAMMAGVVNGHQLNAESAYGAAMFYVITYVLTTLAAFGIILLLARQGHEAEDISDLAGLNQRSPLFAGVMALAMFSLAGIPPLVGFYAKLAVLQSLMAAQQTSYLLLTVFAVLASLIGAFYYLRVIKVMYFDAPQVGMPSVIVARTDARVVLTLNGGLLLLLGLAPGGLMTLCGNAMASSIKTLVN
jgi:NADH-quinone oxidoreductase subunit N